MVDVSTDGENVIFEVEGSHKFWALTSRLIVPVKHIISAVRDPDPAMGWFEGLKIAGTDMPNIFRAGLFYQHGDKVFWDVRHPENTVVISLADERFTRLIIEVEDPEFVVHLINTAIGAGS